MLCEDPVCLFDGNEKMQPRMEMVLVSITLEAKLRLTRSWLKT